MLKKNNFLKRGNNMKKLLFFLIALFIISAVWADQIAFQGFEGSDSWNYSEDPAAFDTGSDIWHIRNSNSSISSAATGTYFWAIRDLDCPSNPNSGVGVLNFSAIDVSGYTGVVLTFKYYTDAFESSDSLRYQVQYDNGTT